MMDMILFDIENKVLTGDRGAGNDVSPIEIYGCDTSLIGKERFLYLFECVLKVLHDYPESDYTIDKFPSWFTSQFSKAMTDEEAKNWRIRWANMSSEKRKEDEKKRGWSFEGWIYWLYAENRTWWYCGVDGEVDDIVYIRVASPECTAFDALYWLINSCGGIVLEDAP